MVLGFHHLSLNPLRLTVWMKLRIIRWKFFGWMNSEQAQSYFHGE